MAAATAGANDCSVLSRRSSRHTSGRSMRSKKSHCMVQGDNSTRASPGSHGPPSSRHTTSSSARARSPLPSPGHRRRRRRRRHAQHSKSSIRPSHAFCGNCETIGNMGSKVFPHGPHRLVQGLPSQASPWFFVVPSGWPLVQPFAHVGTLNLDSVSTLQLLCQVWG